ncbi:AAA family ATPase [Sinomicrobium kalidii]|uniref:AAA family ATPase n=1 Tax=Sinomicrobium kalidii TaxID=2900738 RepID=UPI001E62E979|nr:AAA family ATPase [Sinomicrobium kalidii]UGU17715.1 AAA family ATPase [Sinomicrobium kalidii]
MEGIKNTSVLADLSREIDQAATKPSKELLSELQTLRIDPKEELQPPQVAIEMDGQILGTLGNFSLVIGKAKSRKSFFISIAISAAISKDVISDKFKGCLPPGHSKVLYFDTEQGKYHAQLALKRICKQVGINAPDNLEVYRLRSKKPGERLELIEAAIENTPSIGLIVIDGIKDLVTSINDEEQATMIASNLLKWTEQKNIHIITVLHQNKSDNNARGHIGTELINKAETVLSVTKAESDPDISIVEPQMCRGKEPNLFAFEIIDGLPVPAENYEIRTETKKNKFDVSDLEDSKVYELLNEVYSKGGSFGYSELVRQLKLAYKNQFGKKIGDNRIKDLITLCKNNKWVIQEKPKAPYKKGDCTEPEF